MHCPGAATNGDSPKVALGPRCRLFVPLLVSLHFFLGATSPLGAALEELLGIMALADEDEVIEQLELTPSQRDRIRKLIIDREDAGLALALDAKDLPPNERRQKLLPFRSESERLGMQLLNFRQRAKLRQFRLQRAGVAALAEPEMREALNLSEKQAEELQALAAERAQSLHSAPGVEIERLEADFHTRMLKVLSESQSAAFAQMLGGARPAPLSDPSMEPAHSLPGDAAVVHESADSTESLSTIAGNPDAATGDSPEANGVAESSSEAFATVESPTDSVADAKPPQIDSTSVLTNSEPIRSPPSASDAAIESVSNTARPADASYGRLDLDEASTDGPTETPSQTGDVVPLEQTAGTDGRLRFSFQYTPWQDVITWFAEQNDLSLQMDAPPQGTFNYTDPRHYTPQQALDLLNRILLGKNHTLLRHGQMLFLINLENGIPANLVPSVAPEDLDSLGESELVSTVFPLYTITTEEARAEVEPLLRQQGSMTELPRSRRIQITETAGRLRLIRSVLDAIESPEASFGELQQLELQYRLADEVLPLIREMLGMETESNGLADGTLRIAVGLDGQRLLVRGTAQRIDWLKEIVQLIDMPGTDGSGLDAIQTPQLEVYPIAGADPAAVLRVLQTILAGDPDARLEVDSQTGNLYALARPSQHATIRATIAQAEQDARKIDVLPLTTVDPQVAVLAIGKLFGGSGETDDPSAPKVDADPTTRSLLVRGTDSQLQQIRSLLEKLGENTSARLRGSNRGNVRVLPLGGREATSALYQIEQIWPALRANRIRVIAPSEGIGIPTFRPSETNRSLQQPPWRSLPPQQTNPGAESRPLPRELPQPAQRDEDADTADLRSSERGAAVEVPPGDETGFPSASYRSRGSELQFSPIRFAVQRDPEQSPATAGNLAEQQAVDQAAPILIAPGPGGIVIASDDTAALDELEALLATVASRSSASGREFAVFYLRYARATTIAEILTEVFGGTASSGGSGLLGDIAGAALGEAGGLVTGLLGVGGGGSLVGASIDIVPDNRLNALIVEAKPADLDTVEQLLRILDQPNSPEAVEVDAPPRLIPVFNTSASQIAAIVQQVYSDRMRASGGQQQQPSPEDILRLLRGGRGGQGGNNREQEEAEKMSVGVDTRSNSLVVRAPDPLFEEVKLLVERLDSAEVAHPESTSIVSLKSSNSASVQRALAAIYGGSIQSSSPAPENTQPGQGFPGQSRGPQAGPQPQDAARAAEFMERMRRFQEFQQRVQQGGGEDAEGQPRRGNR